MIHSLGNDYFFSPPSEKGLHWFIFTSPFVSMEMVGKVLFSEIKLEYRHIEGVQNISRDKMVVKFDCHETFRNVIQDYDEKIMQIDAIESVRVVNISTEVTFVSVRNAPFEMKEECLINISSRYGKVESMRNNRFAVGPFAGRLNGTRTARMKLRENIPSSINVSGYNLAFIYNGQKRTCYICGSEGHMAKDCTTDMTEKVNMWNEKDFPSMASRELIAEGQGKSQNIEEEEVTQDEKIGQKEKTPSKESDNGEIHIDLQGNNADSDITVVSQEVDNAGENMSSEATIMDEKDVQIHPAKSSDEGLITHMIQADVHQSDDDDGVQKENPTDENMLADEKKPKDDDNTKESKEK